MLAIHFENLLFLLFIAIALLFQLLTRAASKASKDSGETKRRSTTVPPPLPRTQTETDEQRIRKFLEALGQPPGSKPPPPVVHRTDIPPRPVAPIQPPAGMRPFPVPARPITPEERRAKRKVILPEESAGEPGEWLRKINIPAQIPKPPPQRKVFVPKTPEPTTFEVHEGPMPAEAPVTIKTPAEAYAIATQTIPEQRGIETEIAALLRSTSGLRDAIILREIFGPPRSLQPLELVGT
jgi:hypothetical protein